MAATSYDDAVGAALQRLRGVGYEFGPSFVNHAPMAAEAMARLGYTDEVPGWVDRNIRARRYYEPPEPRWALTGAEEDWRPALGDFGRVADWTGLLDRELAAEPWTDVLARWWPRLLPGMSGVLAHGVIRTAHAVRALAAAQGDTTLQRGELAHGLGYWAARYHGPTEPDAARTVTAEPGGPSGSGGSGGPTTAEAPAADSEKALRALDDLVAERSGQYVATPQGFPIPLIHTITCPAAVRLVCDHLPPEHHRASFEAAKRSSDTIGGYFGGLRAGKPVEDRAEDPGALIAAAVEIGDEHAIKLAEVAIRFNEAAPDPRYFAASRTATRQIAGHRP